MEHKVSISKNIISLILIIFSAGTLLSCASGRYLRTEQAVSSDITGSYVLILHGGRYSEDIENVAILDAEGDQYTFEMFAPEGDYSVNKNISATEAIDKAQKHVSRHRSFLRSRLSRVLDPQGNVIGYELRPIYQMFEFGDPDVLSVNYRFIDNRVIVNIWTRKELMHEEPFLLKRKFE